MFGFGTLDIFDDNEDIVCPICESLLPVNTCGFLYCKYSYIGKKYEDGKIEEVEYNNENKKDNYLEYFDKGSNNENMSKWIELKITANEL